MPMTHGSWACSGPHDRSGKDALEGLARMPLLLHDRLVRAGAGDEAKHAAERKHHA